ncbi:GLEYA motif domain-containing protein [Hirsutella rhossiliensis]
MTALMTSATSLIKLVILILRNINRNAAQASLANPYHLRAKSDDVNQTTKSAASLISCVPLASKSNIGQCKSERCRELKKVCHIDSKKPGSQCCTGLSCEPLSPTSKIGQCEAAEKCHKKETTCHLDATGPGSKCCSGLSCMPVSPKSKIGQCKPAVPDVPDDGKCRTCDAVCKPTIENPDSQCCKGLRCVALTPGDDAGRCRNPDQIRCKNPRPGLRWKLYRPGPGRIPFDNLISPFAKIISLDSLLAGLPPAVASGETLTVGWPGAIGPWDPTLYREPTGAGVSPNGPLEYVVVAFTGYFIPVTSGTYTFEMNFADDAAFLWVGPKAGCGCTQRNADIVADYWGLPKEGWPGSFKFQATADQPVPIRIVVVNSAWWITLHFWVKNAGGQVVMSHDQAAIDGSFVAC